MKKEINLGLGVKLDIFDTDYAKSFILDNTENKLAQEIGFRLK